MPGHSGLPRSRFLNAELAAPARPVVLAAAVLLTALTAPALGARELSLPGEMGLQTQTVVLELDDADIEVQILGVDEGPARLVGRPAVATRDGQPVEARLGVEATADRFTLMRSGGSAERLRLELQLDPDQALEVRGRDLAVTVRDPSLPEPAGDRRRDRDAAPGPGGEKPAPRAGADVATGEGPPASYVFAVAASQVHLTGLDGLVVEAEGSWVGTEGTRGSGVVTANGSTVSVSEHGGPLDVLATDSEVSVDGIAGALQADLLGGSFNATAGDQRMDLKANEALVLVTGWRGGLSADLSATTFELQGAANPSQTALRADASRLVLSGLRGSGQVNLVGGSLEGSAIEGQLRMEARSGGEVRIEGSRGRFDLVLSDVEASLSDLSGRLNLEAHDSRTSLDGVEHLEATVARGSLTSRGVARLRRLEADSVDLDLDLSELSVDATLSLQGESELEATLSTPCVVQVQGVSALVGERVSVSGCDLRSPEQAARSARNRARYGQRPRTLTVRITSGVDLSVSGI
ncbi:MAG: hypothetical protein AAGN66_00375 [Acidobacteriota bacterium]